MAQTVPTRNRTKELDVIGFKWSKGWTDRGIAVGGTGTGKSTLCEEVINNALARVSNLHVLILDSKPRFRAQYETTGVSAARRYAKWDHGTAIPNSYRLPLTGTDQGLEDVWRYGSRVAIAQTDVDDPDDKTNLTKISEAAQSFLRNARSSVPSLLYADEVMDFFSVSGQSLTGNAALLRAARAGRERGLALLCATQRPRGIPVQLVQEANKLYLFRLRNVNDVDHLEEFGTPDDLAMELPKTNHVFYYYDHEEGPSTAGKYRLVGLTNE